MRDKTTIQDALIKRLAENPETFERYLSAFQGRRILIYGAGAFGREMLEDLRKNEVEVTAFLDKNAQALHSASGIAVFSPDYSGFDASYRKEAVVFLAIVLSREDRREIESFLAKLGYCNVIDAQRVRALRVPYDESCMAPDSVRFSADRDAILSAYDLMADDHSRDIYAGAVCAHLKRRYEDAPESERTTQYFSPNVPFGKGFYRFVDCGAYVGDTLEKLNQSGNWQMYVGFEPNPANFAALSQKADLLKIHNKCHLHPCAVGRKNTVSKFTAGIGSGALGSEGETYVRVVCLDDALKDFDPTMIKMDVEGEEYNVLLGAKNIISWFKPDLAVCVYHYISDYWRIPRLIDSWQFGYKFYLRTHSSAAMETVLYAVCERI